jgi:hypothetical protein
MRERLRRLSKYVIYKRQPTTYLPAFAAFISHIQHFQLKMAETAENG